MVLGHVWPVIFYMLTVALISKITQVERTPHDYLLKHLREVLSDYNKSHYTKAVKLYLALLCSAYLCSMIN